ncbi:MAG: M24 family metallopeptidase, partial [bacterium]
MHPQNLFYLCGFSGSSGALIVTGGAAVLIIDGRYTIQAAQEVQGAEVSVSRKGLWPGVGNWLRRWKVRRVGYEANRLTTSALSQLRKLAAPGVRWAGLDGCVEAVRARKDAEEIRLLRQAAQLGGEVFKEIVPLIKPGVREVELAAELEYRMRRRGASGPAFETIVAFGERTALPHARATERALRTNELVLLDWGAILSHYCCDLTRTVYLGRAPSRIRQWYHAVLEAQQAAREAVRAGRSAGQVDRAARRVLQRAGLVRFFVHSTGHGLGLEVHESPSLAKGRTQLLEAGNVVTIEPGVYIEGVG